MRLPFFSFLLPRRRIGSGSYIFSGLASKEKPISIEETDEKPVGEKERQKPLSSESASSIHGHTIEDSTTGSNQGDVARGSGRESHGEYRAKN